MPFEEKCGKQQCIVHPCVHQFSSIIKENRKSDLRNHVSVELIIFKLSCNRAV